MPRNKLIMISRFLIVLLGEISFHGALAGEYPETEAEFARLPPYCYVRLKQNNGPEAQQWSAKLGNDCWIHLHHYCAGLNSFNNSLNIFDKTKKANTLKTSVLGNYQYMWDKAGPSCILMPEVMVNKGRALMMLNQTYDALGAYRKAMDLNQRYIPAYIELAGLYTRSGQTDVARTILDYALKVEPHNKSVQRRLADLDHPRKSGSAKTETTQ